MTDEYKTLKTGGEGYYTDKRSKFLAFAHHVSTVDEIKDLLADYRKKYYDARHVCYAYMLGAGREEFRANDDGEPSSTAGKPILGQINSNELTDILIVVVRYYGGVNLGSRRSSGDLYLCLSPDERRDAYRQGHEPSHRQSDLR